MLESRENLEQQIVTGRPGLRLRPLPSLMKPTPDFGPAPHALIYRKEEGNRADVAGWESI
jgi:hypothetical protein